MGRTSVQLHTSCNLLFMHKTVSQYGLVSSQDICNRLIFCFINVFMVIIPIFFMSLNQSGKVYFTWQGGLDFTSVLLKLSLRKDQFSP